MTRAKIFPLFLAVGSLLSFAQNPPTVSGSTEVTTRVLNGTSAGINPTAQCNGFAGDALPGSVVVFTQGTVTATGQIPEGFPSGTYVPPGQPTYTWQPVQASVQTNGDRTTGNLQGVCVYGGALSPPRTLMSIQQPVTATLLVQNAVTNTLWSACASVNGIGACVQIPVATVGPQFDAGDALLPYQSVITFTYTCPNEQTLNATLGVCCDIYMGEQCNSDNSCSYYDCPGNCQEPECSGGGGGGCSSDEDCNSGDICDDSTCVLLADGNPTGGGGHCGSYTDPNGNWICSGRYCQNGCTSNGCNCAPTDPIIIDLTGNGYLLTDVAGGVKFDFAGKGNKVKMSWTAGGWEGGFLVLDRNHNGRIEDGTELFGNLTPQPTPAQGKLPNGFAALAVYDLRANGGNGDGVIDEKDEIYSKLQVWIDRNHDGVSEPSELYTLAQVGVKSISLNYSNSQWKDAKGNVFRYKSQIKDKTPNPTVYDVLLGMAVPNKANTVGTKAP